MPGLQWDIPQRGELEEALQKFSIMCRYFSPHSTCSTSRYPVADQIQHAGAIFLGAWTPEAVGDYLAGPNHTLPTSGTARFAGALSVETFLRHTSLIQFNRAALEATGPAVITLAESEGLHSHAESVRRRLQ